VTRDQLHNTSGEIHKDLHQQCFVQLSNFNWAYFNNLKYIEAAGSLSTNADELDNTFE
jgi:hypothetical protein